MELNPITQTQALKIIETEIGFPNPTANFVEWYFKEDGGTFIPIVNFETLAKEIQSEGLIAKMAEVTGLPHDNPIKDKVVKSIYKVVKKHSL